MLSQADLPPSALRAPPPQAGEEKTAVSWRVFPRLAGEVARACGSKGASAVGLRRTKNFSAPLSRPLNCLAWMRPQTLP